MGEWREVASAVSRRRESRSAETPARVTRIDGEGRAWVTMPGSSAETPVALALAPAAVGDTVGVRVSGGRATIVSNASVSVGAKSGTGTAAPVAVAGVTGVKGSAEDEYRTGDVDIGEADIGIELLGNAEINDIWNAAV